MFDALTAALLRSAPELPELNPADIPQILTRQYAQLVAIRLSGSASDDAAEPTLKAWPLERIADAYEIVASLEHDAPTRRAASFVAATAHQILSRQRAHKELDAELVPAVDRDSVDPAIAAALLFLAAEQYADANEAAFSFPRFRGSPEAVTLGLHIRDLARGKLESIVDRAQRRRGADEIKRSLQGRAFGALTSVLCEGIEIMAASILGDALPEDFVHRFDSAETAFRTVLNLSRNIDIQGTETLGSQLITRYAGPDHLASLLLNASDGIQDAALTRIPPPLDANSEFWRKWLRFRAKDTPYLWKNHREAIRLGFAQTGTSAVLVLPTGAGKTTVSALKIAGTLARGKKVVFLAPTHALVEQLTDDLQAIFPSETFGLQVSNDFDSLFVEDSSLKDIEVMTPERCLAMMSFEPKSFANVGLLVFDECHLLSPDSGKLGRALDGMLCVLTFNSIAKSADLLFLSAMLKNGGDFAEWIGDLTARRCVYVELMWKPSRQARGVVAYERGEIRSSLRSARQQQQKLDGVAKKKAKTLRSLAQKELKAVPHAVWGLTHNWIASTRSHAFTSLSDHAFDLTGGYGDGRIWVNPNANKTAGRIAVGAASTGIKTIIFVNTKADAVSLAQEVAKQIGDVVSLNEREEKIWEALVSELGDAKHAIYGGANLTAVPHNSSMLRLERLLAESLFRRTDGARVIVATPTLAQGLNLPAQLAILAGDKRAGDAKNPRENLQAHELLNAAARAGRAGHLANGVVLLIPEPIVTFESKDVLDVDLKQKLSAILPEDDRCVSIRDPLEIILDRITAGVREDRAVEYTISRLAIIESSDEQSVTSSRLLKRSYGAFLASKRGSRKDFDTKIEHLRTETKRVVAEGDALKVLIASQSGLPVTLVTALSARLEEQVGSLPTTVLDWTRWTIDWLSFDKLACAHLLHDTRGQVLSALGQAKTAELTGTVLQGLLPALQAWLEGRPIAEIEALLGGDPNSDVIKKRVCPRARDLISSVIPRGLSFILGLISHTIDEHELYNRQPDLDRTTVQSLSALLRKGYDTVGKLQYSQEHRSILSRVEIHKAYQDSIISLFNDDDLL